MATNNWDVFFKELQENWDTISEHDREQIYYNIDKILVNMDILSDLLHVLSRLCKSTEINEIKKEKLKEINSLESIYNF